MGWYWDCMEQQISMSQDGCCCPMLADEPFWSAIDGTGNIPCTYGAFLSHMQNPTLDVPLDKEWCINQIAGLYPLLA